MVSSIDYGPRGTGFNPCQEPICVFFLSKKIYSDCSSRLSCKWVPGRYDSSVFVPKIVRRLTGACLVLYVECLLVGSGDIHVTVKRFEHGEDRGKALYKCHLYLYLLNVIDAGWYGLSGCQSTRDQFQVLCHAHLVVGFNKCVTILLKLVTNIANYL